jgi:hypothetical protein
VIRDEYSIVVPEGLANGRYPVWLGMYDPASGVRLPLTVGSEGQPDQAYLVDWMTILR